MSPEGVATPQYKFETSPELQQIEEYNQAREELEDIIEVIFDFSFAEPIRTKLDEFSDTDSSSIILCTPEDLLEVLREDIKFKRL